ncbi:MAG: riboflavin biosynthesis protein RibF [Bacteroidales bacterium]|nr:riboflavin biosynthesis protein RibF [Bacteroidales bacterium]MCF8390888.1 riboflavin biosynthesis protein RibF [Bacteroidales bacterium]
MKIWHEINKFKAVNPVATVGVFDGVHPGHKFLLNKLKDKAKELGGESVLITLWPHPRYVLEKDHLGLRYLSTIDEKIILIENEGVDHLVIIPFSQEFSQLTSCEFIREFLIRQMKIKHLLLGYDHKFGKDRQGDLEILKQCATDEDFSISRAEAFNFEETRVSSSLIRKLILEGDLDAANHALDYNYFLLGTVVEGNKLGREIGFPTANIKLQDKNKLLPKVGVYAVYLSIEGKIYPGMLNIGYRPTVDSGNHNKSVEVHLFDFKKNIYGKRVALSFRKRMRDEKKFDSIEELKEQLTKDKEIAIQVLKD